MRYIIEVKTKKGEEFISKCMNELGASNADYIDSYEPKERIARSVEKIGLALREYKKNGVSFDILRFYLRGKGHTQTEVDALLGDVEGFFKKMGLLE